MGLKGRDFVVVCSDTVASQSIIRMKADENKIVEIDDHKIFALSGILQLKDPLLINLLHVREAFRHCF